MSSAHSVSEWIASLRQGQVESIQKLWDRFRSRLLEAARIKLAKSPKTLVDEEDVSQSVLIDIWEGINIGLFDDVRNRDELWWLLLKITKRRIVDSVRHETSLKRHGTRIFFTLEELIDPRTSTDVIDELENSANVVLATLHNPELQKIAHLRIMGYAVHEIAEQLSIPKRSIERKLQLIRGELAKELERVGAE
jgi:DNA-directed RNA polymerase specialized sigma24 family protein